MPSFIGGDKALKEYLAKNISMAQSDIERGVSGKVWIRFYVDVDGSVKDVTVIKDNAGGQCAERALKAVRQMPKWNPGMQNNAPVRVYYSLPIVFEVKDMQ
jgi:protein TonB